LFMCAIVVTLTPGKHQFEAKINNSSDNSNSNNNNYNKIRVQSHLRPTNPSLNLDAESKEALKNGVFWDVTPCGSCNNRRFVGT
jgi:hypothetical protein